MTGIEIVKQFEGCRLKAYQCPAKIWTIGYGRTTDVHPGDTCTQAQADAWLAIEYATFHAQVSKLITVKSTPAQIDALTSLAYNIGLANLTHSTLLRLHNAGRFTEGRAQFALWNKGDGKVLPGLVRRRAAEADLYGLNTK